MFFRQLTGIGSRACQLPIPVIMSLLPRELPELYAKPYSLTVNFQSLHFYFSCMHSARMLRSTCKNNTDCPILSLYMYRSFRSKYTVMLSPQWESRSEFNVHSGNATVHSTRKLLVHTLSCRLSATGDLHVVGSYGTGTAVNARPMQYR